MGEYGDIFDELEFGATDVAGAGEFLGDFRSHDDGAIPTLRVVAFRFSSSSSFIVATFFFVLAFFLEEADNDRLLLVLLSSLLMLLFALLSLSFVGAVFSSGEFVSSQKRIRTLIIASLPYTHVSMARVNGEVIQTASFGISDKNLPNSFACFTPNSVNRASKIFGSSQLPGPEMASLYVL